MYDSPGKNTRVGCHARLQGNLPNPGIEPTSPALQADSLLSEPPGEPQASLSSAQTPGSSQALSDAHFHSIIFQDLK